MLGKRMNELLDRAADALEKGMDPFSNWFLVENEVSLDECMALSEAVGGLIKWYLKQPAEVKVKVALHELGPLANYVAAHMGYLDTLRRVNEKSKTHREGAE